MQLFYKLCNHLIEYSDENAMFLWHSTDYATELTLVCNLYCIIGIHWYYDQLWRKSICKPTAMQVISNKFHYHTFNYLMSAPNIYISHEFAYVCTKQKHPSHTMRFCRNLQQLEISNNLQKLQQIRFQEQFMKIASVIFLQNSAKKKH